MKILVWRQIMLNWILIKPNYLPQDLPTQAVNWRVSRSLYRGNQSLNRAPCAITMKPRKALLKMWWLRMGKAIFKEMWSRKCQITKPILKGVLIRPARTAKTVILNSVILNQRWFRISVLLPDRLTLLLKTFQHPSSCRSDFFLLKRGSIPGFCFLPGGNPPTVVSTLRMEDTIGRSMITSILRS